MPLPTYQYCPNCRKQAFTAEPLCEHCGNLYPPVSSPSFAPVQIDYSQSNGQIHYGSPTPVIPAQGSGNILPEEVVAEGKCRVFASPIGGFVREADMLPFLQGAQIAGEKIEAKPGTKISLNRPVMPASIDSSVSLPSATMWFQWTTQGWERVARPKPSCLTPVIAWAVGGVFLLRSYGRNHTTEGPRADETNHDIQVMLVCMCFLAGLIMWAWDWWQYKHSSD